MKNLYLVKLIDSRNGDVVAGCHVLAETGFEARQIGKQDIMECAPEGFVMTDDHGFISQRSSASHKNAVNA